MGCLHSVTARRSQKKKERESETDSSICECIMTEAAIKIQSWWRGTLVRRTLLHAALCAWIIQCWWRMAYMRLLDQRRRTVLQFHTRQEGAVVLLQAVIRMWRVRRIYLRARAAACLIQLRWRDCLTRGLARTGRFGVTASGLTLDMQLLFT